MSSRLGCALVRGLGAASLLLGIGLLAPRPVAATCGDYLIVGGDAVAGKTAAHSMEGAHPLLDGAPQKRASSGGIPEKQFPCRGASCSNGSLPPATPAPTVEVSLDRWLIASAGSALRLDAADSWSLPADATPIVGWVSDLLRPPRP